MPSLFHVRFLLRYAAAACHIPVAAVTGSLYSFNNLFTCPALSNKVKMSGFSILERGTLHTDSYRLYFRGDNGFISPFHDIPLYADEATKTCNMVVEIPRWSNAKMEIKKELPLNPIVQDIKKGKPRYVANVFPHHGYIWNYGAIPQTWENPNVVDQHTGQKGDNDPIDVMEIGSRVAKRGEVLKVKILGLIGLIDEGETDWKIISIDTADPLASQMNDIADVEKHFPGLMKATVEWLRLYKVPDGKPENQFAFNAEYKDREFALNVISETHVAWTELMNMEASDTTIIRSNSLLSDKSSISQAEADNIVNSVGSYEMGPEPDEMIHKWHFVHLK